MFFKVGVGRATVSTNAQIWRSLGHLSASGWQDFPRDISAVFLVQYQSSKVNHLPFTVKECLTPHFKGILTVRYWFLGQEFSQFQFGVELHSHRLMSLTNVTFIYTAYIIQNTNCRIFIPYFKQHIGAFAMANMLIRWCSVLTPEGNVRFFLLNPLLLSSSF